MWDAAETTALLARLRDWLANAAAASLLPQGEEHKGVGGNWWYPGLDRQEESGMACIQASEVGNISEFLQLLKFSSETS